MPRIATAILFLCAVLLTDISRSFAQQTPAGGIMTGLTVGNSYWFDTALSVNAGSASEVGVTCTAMEF